MSFTSIHQAPKDWRYLGGWKLNVEHLNEIVDTANEMESADKPFVVALHEAREKFKSTHEPVDGMWRKT